MPLPLISTPPISQNARVQSFPVGSDESPRQLSGLQPRPGDDLDEQIERAYRQIFFHAFKVDREPVLESRLRSGQITMRDFVRGLLNSAKFRNDFYRCNSNYQVVDQIVGRVLGRQVHGDRERIALSILIAEQGLSGLIDHLLDSPEYLEHFGTDVVPYQRGRVLGGHGGSLMPFNQQAPRYGAYWRQMTDRRAPAGRGTAWAPSGGGFSLPRPAWLADAPSPLARRIWQGVVTTGGFAITALVLYTAATMLSTAGAG
ncbi:MAG: phycobilisome rod-core linker polypeptide [Cyanobacteriota bacterium]|jgi:phycobilisome rod-core linker protein